SAAAGTLVHSSGGDLSSPWQVYSTGMGLFGENALEPMVMLIAHLHWRVLICFAHGAPTPTRHARARAPKDGRDALRARTRCRVTPARYPARLRCCATSARGRCGGWDFPRDAPRIRPRSTRTARQATRHPSRCARP